MKEQRREPTWGLAKQALSHPDRVRMLTCITGEGTGMDTAGLAVALEMTRARVAYHLMVLCNAGLVEVAEEASGYVPTIPGPGFPPA